MILMQREDGDGEVATTLSLTFRWAAEQACWHAYTLESAAAGLTFVAV